MAPSDLVRARSGTELGQAWKGWENELVWTVAALAAETVPCSTMGGSVPKEMEVRNLTVAGAQGAGPQTVSR
jgi:hypothetical protein